VERSSALGVKQSEVKLPSGTEPGTSIASKGVGLESKSCSP